VPVLEWLVKLRKSDQPAYARCVAAVERLAVLGHELRRPLADLLRDGIYELRIRKGRVKYRILYFYHGPGLAILGHAITKEDVIPDKLAVRYARGPSHLSAQALPAEH